MSNGGKLKLMILHVGETEEIGNNGFKKRELIGIDRGSKYSGDYKIDFVQDKVSLLDGILIGTFVTIYYNLKGNKVTKDGRDMYFTNIQGWKIDI